MSQHPYIIAITAFIAGAFVGWAWGWNRACWYRDRLEAKYPRTRA